jgi:Bifunctional DNA primase/polymerase, N-terminal
VVALRPRSKAPAQHAWQELRIGEDAIDATFQPNSNIGLLMGAASDGLVDVDLDSSEAQIAAENLLPFTPMMFGRADEVEHGRYTHYLYQIEAELPTTE